LIHFYKRDGMDWVTASFGANSTLSSVWARLSEAASDQASAWGKEVFDRVVIPVGQILLHHTEKAVQYTLNGDYEAVQDATRTTFTNTLSWLDLTTFQVKLLREFFVIFLGNSLLVLVAWRIYGARIRNKFMTVSGERRGSQQSRKTIEELRTSRSELKLPNQMDFKFK